MVKAVVIYYYCRLILSSGWILLAVNERSIDSSRGTAIQRMSWNHYPHVFSRLIFTINSFVINLTWNLDYRLNRLQARYRLPWTSPTSRPFSRESKVSTVQRACIIKVRRSGRLNLDRSRQRPRVAANPSWMTSPPRKIWDAGGTRSSNLHNATATHRPARLVFDNKVLYDLSVARIHISYRPHATRRCKIQRRRVRAPFHLVWVWGPRVWRTVDCQPFIRSSIYLSFAQYRCWLFMSMYNYSGVFLCFCLILFLLALTTVHTWNFNYCTNMWWNTSRQLHRRNYIATRNRRELPYGALTSLNPFLALSTGKTDWKNAS